MNMKVPPKKTTTQNANSAQSVDLEGQIRRRAYELYEVRGRGDGRDREDWLQAEAELASERQNLLRGETVKASRKRRGINTGKAKASQPTKSRSSAPVKSQPE